MAKVSVIVTVFNEEDTLLPLIKALTNQTSSATEIIIVDGGSTDSTWKLLQKTKGVRYFQNPGNRSVGRNFGVSKSKYPLIAFTDAGCVPDLNWLEELLKPFADSAVSVVSGYYRGESKNIFQKCLIPYVLVMPDVANKSEFYPSTRSMALRRVVWDKSGGFDPTLYHNEDYAYAHRLKSLGYSFTFAPLAVVSWIPRKTLIQAAWMFMRFAIGDIQAKIIRPQVKRLAMRYLVFVYLFFLSFELTILKPFIILLAICYLLLSIRKNYRYVKDIRAIIWLPILQITADLSVLFGSAVGLFSTLK